jgi:hypothetical protein
LKKTWRVSDRYNNHGISHVLEMVNSSVKVSIFPKSPNASCSSGCGASCSSCSTFGSTGINYLTELEAMDELQFRLEEVSFETDQELKIQMVDTSNLNYTLELLNVALITSGEAERVSHENFDEFMTKNGPIITMNNIVQFKGKLPTKKELAEKLSSINS